MIEVVLDFETVNPYCDLTAVGSTVYSEHWATEVFCLRWQVDAGRMHKWTPGYAAEEGALHHLAARSDAIFIAHGAGFEKDIWRNIMEPQFGFPDIPNERWRCTQAVCAYRSVPQGLDGALKAVLGREKDTEGSKLVISLSRFGNQRRLWRPGKGHPRDAKGRELQLPARTPELMERCYAYCASDVAEETLLHERLGPLHGGELAVWQLDQRINERGVALDREFLRGAQRIIASAKAPLEEEFRQITDGIGAGQVAATVAWVNAQGVRIDNLQKQTIATLLGQQAEEDDDDEDVGSVPGGSIPRLDVLPTDVRRALVIRSLVGSASIRKLSRMEGCIADDGRAHRLLQYHGTGPGRWAGRLFNPLNFPRGTAVSADNKKPCDADTLSRAILSGDVAEVDALDLVVEDPPLSKQWRRADPIEVVSSALRHAIIPGAGKRLVVGDFVQIQARIVLALAGQTDFLAKLAAGMDPYLLTAEQIYGDPPGSLTKADTAKRQTGKNTFLGCGFAMGAAKFHEKYCPEQPLEFAQQAIDAYRHQVAPLVPKLWAGLEKAANAAAWGEPTGAYGVYYELDGGWLSVRLPDEDKKKLWYWNPQRVVERVVAERPVSGITGGKWVRVSREHLSPSYSGVFGRTSLPDRAAADGTVYERFQSVFRGFNYETVKGGRLVTNSAYGGLLTENVVMGLERQLLVRAMQTCEKENLPVIFNSYDEIVCEPETAHASWPALKEIMEDTPTWAKALKLPIAAEGWVGDRYKKG